ncbi:MAG: hypothetical protein DRP54_02565 [Spirochaetes bacterium]|nr:MAG: hypothetical protein DRP54_02565 [Spirochaetota bacterium]
MKKKLIVLTMALVIFASPVFVKADYYWMSSGFIERAEVKDGITATASGWFWTWPTYLNGFGIGGTAENRQYVSQQSRSRWRGLL